MNDLYFLVGWRYLGGINSNVHKVGRFTRVLCVLVIVGLLDAHVGMMQVLAWARMLHDRIPEQGIEQALGTTFSGDYPCEKCRAIAELREKEADEHSSSPLRSSVDLDQMAKLIGVFTQVKPVYVCLVDVNRVSVWAVEVISPDDFITEVASPPPRVV